MYSKSIFIKVFTIINFLILMFFVSSCKNKRGYILFDDNGTIKCKNYDYIICLEKEKGKDFKILNFADVQLSSDDVFYESGVASYAYSLMDELINETNPDLITLSGDQGYGEQNSINAISSVINAHNIPWAYVFGNHDNECNELSIKEQVDLYASYSNCIAKYGPEDVTESESGIPRAGNYIINIVERDDKKFHIVRSIFMLNSGDRSEPYPLEERLNNHYYEYLNDKQIEFYKWGLESAKKYNNGEYPKSTIIEHIPIAAYAFAFAEAFLTDYSPYEYTKIHAVACGYLNRESYEGICWKDGYKDSFGVCYEVICCPPKDDKIFDTILEYGSTDSMIVGHDHKNNFSINYKGVRLSYGLKTGHGSYYDSSLNGGTILIVNDEGIKIEHIYKQQAY